MPKADRLSAISASKPRIRLILTPSAGVISYSVIVGPTVALIRLIFTPKLLSTSTIRALLALISSMSMTGFESYFFSKSNEGKRYFVKGSQGLIGTFRLTLLTGSLELANSSPFCTATLSFSSCSLLPVFSTTCGCRLAGCA